MGNQHGRIDGEGIEEEAPDGLLDAVDTFGIKTGRFVGSNGVLNFGAVGNLSVVGRLVLGSKRRVMMKATKDGLNVAGHGKIALVVEIIPPKGDTTEECAGPVGGYFITGVGKSAAEEICVLLSCVFNTKIVNEEQKSEGSFRCCVSRGQECDWLV